MLGNQVKWKVYYSDFIIEYFFFLHEHETLILFLDSFHLCAGGSVLRRQRWKGDLRVRRVMHNWIAD
jgi:hypothetical protein